MQIEKKVRNKSKFNKCNQKKNCRSVKSSNKR